jgi:hypothetical protein
LVYNLSGDVGKMMQSGRERLALEDFRLARHFQERNSEPFCRASPMPTRTAGKLPDSPRLPSAFSCGMVSGPRRPTSEPRRHPDPDIRTQPDILGERREHAYEAVAGADSLWAIDQCVTRAFFPGAVRTLLTTVSDHRMQVLDFNADGK